jgi:hypothetical protein
MINAKEGKEGFQSQRGRSEKRKDDKEPNDEIGKTHTRFATPKKKRTPPSSSSSEDEASEKPKKKGQKRIRSTKSNKQASVESGRGLQDCEDRTFEAEGMDAPTIGSAFKASPPKERWAWGSTDAETFKPAWGGLQGYDDHQDDRRIDGEWGGTQEKHDRREHDKNVGSGRSPPPKGMGRKTAMKSSGTLEGQLWGREWGWVRGYHGLG